jgi:arsenate reductase
MEIWHNPKCSKSRATKEILDEAGVAYVERRYLEDAPTVEQLDAALTALGVEPWQIARKGDVDASVLDGLGQDRQAWLAAMVANPILIERPIVIADDGRAVIGRPPESVRSLL